MNNFQNLMLLVNSFFKWFSDKILSKIQKVTIPIHQSKYINVSIFATRKILMNEDFCFSLLK